MASTLVSRLTSLRTPSADSGDESASIISSQGTCSSLSGSSLDASSASGSYVPRKNEHLAVLLPKHLWKPDAQASLCDIFMCRKKFSLWERKHHCRKCGGVFCGECSSRATDLLDTSKLDFLNPPKHVPITTFHSPLSPVRAARVCDDCWEQVHGLKNSHSPITAPTVPLAFSPSEPYSADSSIAGSPVSPLEALPPRSFARRAYASPRFHHQPGSPLRTASPLPNAIAGAHVSDADLGELETYPLRFSSAVCKATGGGRWEPKPVVRIVGQRVPGGKASYELDLEREEEELRIRRANPILRDGDFQLRVPRELEPCSPGGPFQLSTF